MSIFKDPIDPSLFRAILLLGCLVLSTAATAWLSREPSPKEWTRDPVVVEILGKVARPGFYILEAGRADVAHAIAAAGGLAGEHSERTGGMTEDSLRHTLRTGQSLRVLSDDSGEYRAMIGCMSAAGRLTVGLKLDVNLASEEELCLVPQMKPEFASAIVARRRERTWTSLRELEEISGIGRKTAERWRDYLEVAGDGGEE